MMDRTVMTNTAARRIHSSLPSTLTPQKSSAKNYLLPHVFTIIFAVILLLGVIVGTLLTKKIGIDALSDLGIITKEFIEVKAGQTFLQNFSSSFISGFLYLLILFFMGFTAIAQPLMLGVVFFKGLGVGLSMGYAYSTLGQNGILAALVFLLPNALFIAFSILWAAKESLKLSVLFFFKLLSDDNHTALGKHAKKMCVKYVGITAFYIVGCALESGIISLFGSFFTTL